MKLPSFIEMLTQLIRSPSISSISPHLDQSNYSVIVLLAEWLEVAGFHVDIQSVPNSRHKYNLVAKLGEGDGGLLLSGHTDTVTFDESRWQTDPFKLVDMNNRLYGLGTVDMKGFFAFILSVFSTIDRNALKKPLYIVATADEETTMSGAMHFANTTQFKPACAIIGEPTSLTPIRAHKGHIANVIRVKGQSGHSSDPEKGINAIEIMYQVIAKLLELKQKLKMRYRNEGFDIPYPTMNLGHIHGGDAANRICGFSELVMDIRPLPGMSIESVAFLLRDAMQPVMNQWPGRITIEYEATPIPGYESPVAFSSLSFIEESARKKAEFVNFCTEAPYINHIAPTFVLGPGAIEQAHQPDEFLSLDVIKPTHELFSTLINHFCR